VLADAFTSVLAIAALLAVKYFGFNWLDPAAGILGAAGIFLVWFYKGRRPDLGPRKDRRDGGGDARMG